MKFIDEVKIQVSSGKGGPGCVSFRREAMVPRGGPDGGDGGRGGDLVFLVDKKLNSLIDYRPGKKYFAKNGLPGSGMNKTGADGMHLVLKVPHGTLVKSSEGHVLLDLSDCEDEQEIVFLKGGRGGKGNTFFKTSVNQAPEKAQPGEMGEEREIILELKLIADVGIIGLPNAGKSTLISRISAAKPKIADYPFTTLNPQLGVVRVGDEASFVVADIPGLIKGAHKGLGLGIQFLKHIERTTLYVHLVDASQATLQPTGVLNSAALIQSYKDIKYELEMYDEMNQGKEGFIANSSRIQLIVFSKIDTLDNDDIENLIQIFEQETGSKPLAISAVTGKGVNQLVQFIYEKIISQP